jgi:mRNA-degrading endonuclease RelE of RelBE toxin-antitoxin system
MSYQIKALKFFKESVEELDEKSRRVIHDKIQLIKENPYRYKRIYSKQYSKVFRVRLSIGGRETRLIYVVIKPNIILVALLDRKGEYKDLEKYLSEIKRELGL